MSFQNAAALKLPLSSHGAKHAPSLERGKVIYIYSLSLVLWWPSPSIPRGRTFAAVRGLGSGTGLLEKKAAEHGRRWESLGAASSTTGMRSVQGDLLSASRSSRRPSLVVRSLGLTRDVIRGLRGGGRALGGFRVLQPCSLRRLNTSAPLVRLADIRSFFRSSRRLVSFAVPARSVLFAFSTEALADEVFLPQIKCDGVQPSCGACRKSALAKGE